MIYERARAKINLTLDVRYKRKDGYHELESVMQTVDLSDNITLTPRDDDEITLKVNVPFLPADDKNLAFKAAQVFKRVYGINRGVHIDIDKRIPIAAGLAGGSSDAAAVLRGLNQLWRVNDSLAELSAVGAQIGSDVPFCVYGGTAIVRGRGERVNVLPIQPVFWVVLAKPAITVSTAEVYAKLRLDEVTDHPGADAMVRALEENSLNQVVTSAGNVLEKVTIEQFPEVARIKEQMLKLGAPLSLMSGSGPTVFALTDKELKAKKIFNSLRATMKEVFLCRTC